MACAGGDEYLFFRFLCTLADGIWPTKPGAAATASFGIVCKRCKYLEPNLAGRLIHWSCMPSAKLRDKARPFSFINTTTVPLNWSEANTCAEYEMLPNTAFERVRDDYFSSDIVKKSFDQLSFISLLIISALSAIWRMLSKKLILGSLHERKRVPLRYFALSISAGEPHVKSS